MVHKYISYQITTHGRYISYQFTTLFALTDSCEFRWLILSAVSYTQYKKQVKGCKLVNCATVLEKTGLKKNMGFFMDPRPLGMHIAIDS